MHTPIALCLTIGRRPELLRQTLESLLPRAEFTQIIAINDFRDEETNEVFRKLCPSGILISLDSQLGHHRAVDAMYEKVQTPYVLHCEDDWLFDHDLMIAESMQLLETRPEISTVCLRQYADFSHDPAVVAQTFTQSFDGISFRRLDRTHKQWHGYTFNPHIASIKLWKDMGGFAQFKKERHVSRTLRKLGQYVAYLEPGACHHIGELDSVSNPPREPRSGFKNFFKKVFKFS
jgi:hypothetical protein